MVSLGFLGHDSNCTLLFVCIEVIETIDALRFVLHTLNLFLYTECIRPIRTFGHTLTLAGSHAK